MTPAENAIQVLQILSALHPLTETQTEQLRVVAEQLSSVQGKLNLTALKEPRDIALLHFYDSLTLLSTGLFTDKKVIDIGCGGGFPAFPLAVCAPDCRVTANDSTVKKLNFIAETASLAGIKNLTTLPGRAEELTREKHRAKFDVAVSRGVARLNILCELCLPFVKRGGYFVAMKGAKTAEELTEAQSAIKQLGGKLESVLEPEIPGLDRSHSILVIRKTADTPDSFPRAYSRITKSPL